MTLSKNNPRLVLGWGSALSFPPHSLFPCFFSPSVVVVVDARLGAVSRLSNPTQQELLKHVAPGEVVDPAVEDFLLDVADDFVDSVTMFACKLAVHRKSDALEVKDIAVHLERAWDIVVPGKGVIHDRV